MEQIKLFKRLQPDSLPLELADFTVLEHKGRWARDYGAFFAPKLRVAPLVVRAVAKGESLFRLFRGVSCLHVLNEYSRFDGDTFSYAWGDLQVFENGEPTVRDALFLRGTLDVPDLGLVRRYLEEMRKRDP